MKYVVYKIAGKTALFTNTSERPQIIEIATVKATNSESASMKAIIGTSIKYVDTIATTHNPLGRKGAIDGVI